VQGGDPAYRAGADAGAGRQRGEGEPVPGDERIARVLPHRDRGDDQPVRRRGGQILVRVDRDVDLLAGERVAQRRDEHPDAEAGDDQLQCSVTHWRPFFKGPGYGAPRSGAPQDRPCAVWHTTPAPPDHPGHPAAAIDRGARVTILAADV
jgi:hypothetical protein